MSIGIFVSSLIFSLLSEISCHIFQTKCIEDLGCFYNGPPFFTFPRRADSRLPQDDLSTTFLLFNRENSKKPQVLTPANESLETSTLDPSLDTKILIHGYGVVLLDNDMIFEVKDELLKHDSYNVMVVNWTSSNRPPYQQAVANARAVGAQVAKFINYHIKKRNADPGRFHVIGHSLGGQMTGYVGERVPGLGRITGLDPAGPYFYDTDPKVRLDPTDAKFVDVIHTHGGNFALQGLGIDQAIGHMDFYPNGGNRQPGCFSTPICHHIRAVNYFNESINTCQYPSVQCGNYLAYVFKKCTPQNSKVAQMGYHATKLNVPSGTRFYLLTKADHPNCGLKY